MAYLIFLHVYLLLILKTPFLLLYHIIILLAEAGYALWALCHVFGDFSQYFFSVYTSSKYSAPSHKDKECSLQTTTV